MLQDELNLISYFMKEVCLDAPLNFETSQNDARLILEFFTDKFNTIGAKAVISYGSGDITISTSRIKTPIPLTATSLSSGAVNISASAVWQGSQGWQGSQMAISHGSSGWQGAQGAQGAQGFLGNFYLQPQMIEIGHFNLYEPESLQKTVKVLRKEIGLKDSI